MPGPNANAIASQWNIGFRVLETFMAVVQKTGPGSKPRISRVVSKSDSDHRTATTAHRTLGLTPAGTICHSNLSLSHYPIQKKIPVCLFRGNSETSWGV